MEENDNWIAFYYPDKNNLSNHEQSDILDTYEECVSWVNNISSGNINFDYECGKNCNLDSGLPYICESTIR